MNAPAKGADERDPDECWGDKDFRQWWSMYSPDFASEMDAAYQGWKAGCAFIAGPACVPEGWKLVPIRPTDEMFDAGVAEDWVGHCEGRGGLSILGNEDSEWLAGLTDIPEGFKNIGIYAAMLAAAPDAPKDYE